MYQLLEPKGSSHNNRVGIQNLSTNRSMVIREMSRVISYYHKTPSLVPTDHILVKLINLLTISLNRDEFAITDACSDRTPEVSRRLGLVHPLNDNPIINSGQFYNSHVSEIIIANETDIPDYETLKKSWYTMSAVNIVTHPFADINMHLCNGRYPNNGGGGYTVIIIDVPSLIIQYKYWVRRGNKSDADVTTLSARHFISQLVIPNMLFDHMDICFINRAMRSYHGYAVPFRVKAHSAQVVDYSRAVDSIIDQQIKALKTLPVDPNNTYTLFPAVLKENWYSSIALPDIIPNLNTRWALELSMVRYMDFLIDVVGERNPTKLRTMRSRVKSDLVAMKNNKEFRDFSGNLILDILVKLDKL